MITEKKVKERRDGTKVEYSVELPETLEEAEGMLGTTGVLQAINYTLTVRASKLADQGVPLTKELKALLKSDPELRALVMKKLKEY